MQVVETLEKILELPEIKDFEDKLGNVFLINGRVNEGENVTEIIVSPEDFVENVAEFDDVIREVWKFSDFSFKINYYLIQGNLIYKTYFEVSIDKDGKIKIEKPNLISKIY